MNFEPRQLLNILLLAGTFCLAGACAPAALQADEKAHYTTPSRLQFFQGLRERKLYPLIELLCQQQLTRSDLSADQHQFYAIELARTLALHAQEVPLAEAEELWTQAEQALSQLPRLAVVRELERSLMRAARAEQLYWLTLAEPYQLPLRQQFLEISGQAQQLLEQTLPVVEQQLKASAASSEPRINEERLDEVRVALARVHLRQGELLLSDVPERTFHFQRSQQLLTPIARRTVKGSREWEAQLLQLTLFRLQRNLSEFDSVAASLNREGMPNSIRARAVAESGRFLLDRKQPTQAAELILHQGQKLGQLTGEMESVRLQALLQMAQTVRARGDERLAAELEQEVDQRLEKLDARGDGYHSRTVRLARAQASLVTQFGPELAGILEPARRAVSRQEWQTARLLYQQALELTARQPRIDLAIQIAPEAAAVEFYQQQPGAAVDLLEKLWRSAPAHAGMERVHLLWSQARGRDYAAQRNAEKLNRYLQALQDHRQRYPDRETRHEATWLLAELQFARTQVTAALELYQQIPAGHPRRSAALQRSLECYRWILQRVRDLQQPLEPWQQQARQQARRVFEEFSPSPLQSPVQAQGLLLACRLLQELPGTDGPDSSQIQQMIQQVRQGSQLQLTDLSEQHREYAAWQGVLQTARAMEGVALVQAGRLPEALQLLQAEETSQKSPLEVLFLARQLGAAATSSPEIEVAIAELLLQVTQPLAASEALNARLNPEQQQELFRLRGEAFLKAGRITPAIEQYERLQQQFPRDWKILLRLHDLYTECNNAACREKQYRLWQQQATREKQGTDLWLEARYRLARAALLTNRSEEAKKIVQVTRLLYPEAGPPELRDRYQKLEQELSSIPVPR